MVVRSGGDPQPGEQDFDTVFDSGLEGLPVQVQPLVALVGLLGQPPAQVFEQKRGQIDIVGRVEIGA